MPFAPTSPPPRRVLPLIVLAQFGGTSLWFAPNAVMPAWQRDFGLPPEALGWLSAAVQAGFVLGTLVFSLLALADRLPARRVFVTCALAGAACQVATLFVPAGPHALLHLLLLRVLTGFLLAGIYPVGMKIVAQWHPQGIGPALGWLVGALVLGTAAPHLLRGLGASGDWPPVLVGVALLATCSAALMAWAVGDPPLSLALRAAPPRAKLGWRQLAANPALRASAGGYFGHMLENYSFWVLVPLIVAPRLDGAAAAYAAFGAIAAGGLGCVLGGRWVARGGRPSTGRSARVAAAMLACSGCCAIVSPWALAAPDAIFALWLGLWGFSVAGDSPQFSALNAHHAPPAQVGQVLTAINGIGFSLSILSIEISTRLATQMPLAWVLPGLALGPMLGLLGMRTLLSRSG
ncbi:MFS transporter [Piscinibacter sp. Jin2]|uniref:MFS transporter n=1 Tax=Aquariibacter lacus TaxID=2801332 RepID=A0A9X1BPF7_9BURK|nr:MFS transporter [Piscinibacter lacus]MBL0718306.1 MFS transporter [Piscinibacter lacus]